MLQQQLGKFKDILIDSIDKLKGSDKRQKLGEIALAIGRGGQTVVAKEFKAGRDTIRLGMHEVRSGIKSVDAFNMRGRKKTTTKLPNLKEDLIKILEPESQTDPTFKSSRKYTRISIKVIKNELIELGYDKKDIPCNQTISTILDDLDYKRRKILKAKPLKKIPETDKIFENVSKMNEYADSNSEVARISIDCKDRIKLGEFSRGGKTRQKKKANDHDFGGEHTTPFGLLDAKQDDLNIYLSKGPVTADFMVDRIREYWKYTHYDKDTKVLVINADNGPENSSKRTQFMKRIVGLAKEFQITVILTYYPPYHSKYNRIERVWGILEQHINGDIMDCENTVKEFCKTMTWTGKHPNVEIVDKIYEKGVKVSKKGMQIIESVIERAEHIEKWCVVIKPQKCYEIDIALII